MKKEKSGIQDWYSDRLQTIRVQRNFLILITIVMLVGILFSGLSMLGVYKSKSIDPFVIEIEKKSGIAVLVDPVTVKEYAANQTLAASYLVRYIKSRELFDPNTFEYDYYTSVRLLSSPDVYYEFRSWVRPKNVNSPMNVYANVKSLRIKINSIQYLDDEYTVQIRFSIMFEDNLSNSVTKNKIVIISYGYYSLDMNQDERYVNPLGFQITSYKVSNEFM